MTSKSLSEMDRLHGVVIETKATECAMVYIHADGYKEVQFWEDMDVQEVQ